MDPKSTTTPRTSQSQSSSLLQPIPFAMALKTHGSDSTLQSPATPQTANAPRQDLSPADCRTLKKLLNDVRTPSPLASPAASATDESLLTPSATEDGSSDAGAEDTMLFMDGDERDDGYADEDESMELSADEMPVADTDASTLSLRSDATDGEYVWSDGDTMGDVTKTPGKKAPPAPELHLNRVTAHYQCAPENVEIEARRVEIEEEVKKERLEQEQAEAAAEDDGFDPDAASDDEDDAVALSDDPEFKAIEAVQAQTGMSVAKDQKDAIIEFEPISPEDRRTSRLFSPKPPTRHSQFESLAASSLNFLDIRPSVTATPSGKHLTFTPISTISESSFTAVPAIRNLEHHKGKENSPSKSRRNASLPEEIAELAREANEGDEEEEDLDKYRDLDLAPIEPVTETEEAGEFTSFESPEKSELARARTLSAGSEMDEQLSEEIYDLRTLTPRSDGSPTRGKSSTSLLPVKHDADHNAEDDVEDDAEDDTPDTFHAAEETQLIVYREDPTFVTVVSMLPEVMFWATAAPVAKLGNLAYDKLVEQFAGLGVEEGGEE